MKHLKTTLILSALLVSTSGMAMDKTAAGAVAGAAIGAGRYCVCAAFLSLMQIPLFFNIIFTLPNKLARIILISLRTFACQNRRSSSRFRI